MSDERNSAIANNATWIIAAPKANPSGVPVNHCNMALPPSEGTNTAIAKRVANPTTNAQITVATAKVHFGGSLGCENIGARACPIGRSGAANFRTSLKECRKRARRAARFPILCLPLCGFGPTKIA
jgi:hypothetical protein